MGRRWDKERILSEYGDADTLADRIVAEWHRADDECKADGLAWYAQASAVAYKVSERYGPAVAAALSPQYDWDWELSELFRLIDEPDSFVSPDCGALGANIQKANDILSGEFDPVEVLGGFKVHAFWALLCDPYDRFEVCVDTWSIRVAVGEWYTDKETKPIFATRDVYHHFQAAYRLAAERLGQLPNVVQAVTWCSFRKRHPKGGRWHEKGVQAA